MPPYRAAGMPGNVLGSCSSQDYRLLHVLARGGTATVFVAEKMGSAIQLALKLWQRPAAAIKGEPGLLSTGESQQMARFEREIGFYKQLHGLAQIVPLIDQSLPGYHPCFAVFPLLPGHTLKQWLMKKGRLSALQSREVMMQVLRALTTLHAHGIAHGDLKPHNIMVDGLDTDTGIHVTLIDFGNAQALTAPYDLLSPGLCSPAYSAPERLRGAPPDSACDLYAWGLVLLECLSGHAAVCGHSVAELCLQQLSPDDVPIPDGLLGHPLAGVLMRVLHKNCLLRETDSVGVLRDFLHIDLQELDGAIQGAGRDCDPENDLNCHTRPC